MTDTIAFEEVEKFAAHEFIGRVVEAFHLLLIFFNSLIK